MHFGSVEILLASSSFATLEDKDTLRMTMLLRRDEVENGEAYENFAVILGQRGKNSAE